MATHHVFRINGKNGMLGPRVPQRAEVECIIGIVHVMARVVEDRALKREPVTLTPVTPDAPVNAMYYLSFILRNICGTLPRLKVFIIPS